MSPSEDVATVAESLQQLGGGVRPEERDHVVTTFARLDQRLRSFKAGEVELVLNVKERDQPSQRTTLEARIARQPVMVATSTHTSFDQALAEVRDDLIRQLTDAKNRTEPRQNRKLRGG